MILHPLSLPACPLFERWNLVIVRPSNIISLPWNHTFTIKTSASYLPREIPMNIQIISALEIHWHFVAFNFLPFCLLFSKPTLTVSSGKYWLSIIFSLITSWKLFLDWKITLTTNEIVNLVCVIVCVSSAGCISVPTESTNVVNSSHNGYCLMRLKSRTAGEGLMITGHLKCICTSCFCYFWKTGSPSHNWSIRVAERLALPTSDQGVMGSNPAGGEILPKPKRRFIAQSLSWSPFHRLEMTEILLKGRKTLTHPSIP